MVNQIKFILYQTEQQFIAGAVYPSGAPAFIPGCFVGFELLDLSFTV
jgi:hypothetical protein